MNNINLDIFLDVFNKLKEVYSNLYWIYNNDAKNIPQIIDKDLWHKVNYNPVLFFKELKLEFFIDKIKDKSFFDIVINVYNDYKKYINSDSTWAETEHKNENRKLIVYFSAEYGFHESFPIYSGGLGILSGDHCGSASDLGLNFIGIGLLYRNGYVDQVIDKDGMQRSYYPYNDFNNLPVELVKDKDNSPVKVLVTLPDREVFIQIWQLKAGRIKLYLLDTDISENSEEDRMITSRLYGGDRETRISQEIVLGMGGVKALKKMGIEPAVWHLNEGHSAFILFERAKDFMKDEKISFEEALKKIKPETVFTTHTPVKAGNEAFTFAVIKKYFQEYCNEINIEINDLIKLGVINDINKAEKFSLTILALRNARFSNGVSYLHKEVSQKMWQEVWPDKKLEDVPIDHVTNGINLSTWMPFELRELFDEYLDKDWENRVDDKDLWQKVFNIPDKKLWDVHLRLKKDFVDYTKENIFNFYKRNNVDSKVINKIIDNLDHENLIIGFARRFAPYKRATLLFHDYDKLMEIINNKDKGIYFVFAGKAHPADTDGKKLIKIIYEYSLKEEFLGKILLLENYNIHVSRYMTSGADVWLNNPRRPYEASGTSGQKAAANGIPNLSVLDGWWVEGYNKKNGWAIGDGKDYGNTEKQDI